jgi:hypothetical protein
MKTPIYIHNNTFIPTINNTILIPPIQHNTSTDVEPLTPLQIHDAQLIDYDKLDRQQQLFFDVNVKYPVPMYPYPSVGTTTIVPENLIPDNEIPLSITSYPLFPFHKYHSSTDSIGYLFDIQNAPSYLEQSYSLKRPPYIDYKLCVYNNVCASHSGIYFQFSNFTLYQQYEQLFNNCTFHWGVTTYIVDEPAHPCYCFWKCNILILIYAYILYINKLIHVVC